MTPDAERLLDALFDGWERHQRAFVNLLRLLPPGALALRALPDSATIGAMCAHVHHERLVSVHENAPEHAGVLPVEEWAEVRDVEGLVVQLDDSAARVRAAVAGRIADGRALDRSFAHPLQLIEFLIFHEAYHHGQIKLALKAAGTPIPEAAIGAEVWDTWRAR